MSSISNITALTSYLKPFQAYFEMEGVSEVCINKPHEVWVEAQGTFTRFEAPALSMDFLWQFATLVAEYNQRDISPEYPSLSSTLPDGARVQFVMEPACERGSFICAIRRQSIVARSLDHYFQQSPSTVADAMVVAPNSEVASPVSPFSPFPSFSPSCIPTPEIRPSLITNNEVSSDNKKLLELYTDQNYLEFLTLAVQCRKNIIISGGTSTGKTTFLNALLQHVPMEERLITIETNREVHSAHPNVVHLLAAEEGRSVSHITMLGLLKASLRLRPDRILVSELRAEEAFPYLRAINSGHPGSITTLHADSPQAAFDQLAFMALQSGHALSRQEWIQYAKSIVHIVVQIKRDREGNRIISEVYFDLAEWSSGASLDRANGGFYE